MKTERGFRLPEPCDRWISWPERGAADAVIAIWSRSSAAWLVPGVGRAFRSAFDLVQHYGNHWYVLWVDRAAEAQPKK